MLHINQAVKNLETHRKTLYISIKISTDAWGCLTLRQRKFSTVFLILLFKGHAFLISLLKMAGRQLMYGESRQQNIRSVFWVMPQAKRKMAEKESKSKNKKQNKAGLFNTLMDTFCTKFSVRFWEIDPWSHKLQHVFVSTLQIAMRIYLCLYLCFPPSFQA